MSTENQRAKTRRKQKYTNRRVNRCWRCGRRHGYMRDFELCRICFRELANRGEIPGIKKSSW
ncbi:MAG: type Z 30S ribosomal protein S14 [Patescibacteria group bacterium]|jgi:small subunit ribosomal protein S14